MRTRTSRRAGTPVDIALPAGGDGARVLQLALTLSIGSGRPCRLLGVRADEPAPGLRRRELATLAAAATVCGARLDGAVLGATDVAFEPGDLVPGDHRVSLGNGGAVAPIIAMLAPLMLRGAAPSTLHLGGATDVSGTPTVEALATLWAPLLARTGGRVDVSVHRPGFAPVGGGRVDVRVTPAPPVPLVMEPDGEAAVLSAECTVAGGLDRSIAVRELEALAALVPLAPDACHVRERDGESPGNVLRLVARFGTHAETFEEFGRFGVPAATVAKKLAARWQRRCRRVDDVPVDVVIAALPLMVTGGGGEIVCREPHERLGRLLDVVRAFGPFGAEWRATHEGGEGVGRLRIG